MMNYLKWGAVGIAATLAVTACGSDSSSSKATTATTAAAATTTAAAVSTSEAGTDTTSATAAPDTTTAASTEPIKVLTMGAYTGPVFGIPELEAAVKARVATVNAAGGINGRQIDLITCDDTGDANAAAACARKAVDENVVAVIGSFTLFGTGVQPILTEAKIPYIGGLPSNPAELTSPVAYPLEGGNSNFAADGQAMANAGCKKAGILFSTGNASAADAVTFATKGVEAGGGTVAKSLGIADNVPDLSAPVATLQNAGAECIMMLTVLGGAAIGAVRQSSQPTMLVSADSQVMPPDLVKNGAAPFLTAQSAYSADAKTTPVFFAEMNAQSPPVPTTRAAEVAWGGADAFVQVATAIKGDVTAASVTEQFNKTTDLKVDVYPKPISFTTENPNASIKRVFNTWNVIYQIKDGAYVQDGDPVDVASILGA
jgi:ABC-type branched-subunit amino acid transport system substrate-binding protein